MFVEQPRRPCQNLPCFVAGTPGLQWLHGDFGFRRVREREALNPKPNTLNPEPKMLGTR